MELQPDKRAFARFGRAVGVAALSLAAALVPAAGQSHKISAKADATRLTDSTSPLVDVGGLDDGLVRYDIQPIKTLGDATTPGYILTRPAIDRAIADARANPDDPAAMVLVAWDDMVKVARDIKDPMAKEFAAQAIAQYFFSYDKEKAATVHDRQGALTFWDQSIQESMRRQAQGGPSGEVCGEFAMLVNETIIRMGGDPAAHGIATMALVPNGSTEPASGHADEVAKVGSQTIVHETDGIYQAAAIFGRNDAFAPGTHTASLSVQTIYGVAHYTRLLSGNDATGQRADAPGAPLSIRLSAEDKAAFDKIDGIDNDLVSRLVGAQAKPQPVVSTSPARAPSVSRSFYTNLQNH